MVNQIDEWDLINEIGSNLWNDRHIAEKWFFSSITDFYTNMKRSFQNV